MKWKKIDGEYVCGIFHIAKERSNPYNNANVWMLHCDSEGWTSSHRKLRDAKDDAEQEIERNKK